MKFNITYTFCEKFPSGCVDCDMCHSLDVIKHTPIRTIEANSSHEAFHIYAREFEDDIDKYCNLNFNPSGTITIIK